MTAVVLYLIGLACVVVTVVLVGADVPSMIAAISEASQHGASEIVPAVVHIVAGLGWALWPFLGGLMLMGFARIILLLGSINRALRGPA